MAWGSNPFDSYGSYGSNGPTGPTGTAGVSVYDKTPYTGWKKHQMHHGVVKLNSKITTASSSYEHGPSFEFEIKRQIASELVNEMLKTDMIDIQEVKSPLTMDTTWYGEIRVVERKDTENVLIDKDIYEVKDKRFTHEQIQEAVLNTFPEYFL